MKHLDFTRREFIKISGFGLASVYLGAISSTVLSKTSWAKNPLPTEYSPFDRKRKNNRQAFSGDHPQKAHKLFWNKQVFDQKVGKLAAPSEFAELIVVGGGVSGLCAAYFLKDQKPIVLEQDSRFGGNAKGESWQGIDYSIGAAYLGLADPGSTLEKFYQSLGIDKKMQKIEEDESLFIGKTRYNRYWKQGTTLESRSQFKKLNAYFLDVKKETNGKIFPKIPCNDPLMRKLVNELDQVSFLSHLKKIVGEPLHPHILESIERYCWSAFGGTADEISSACGLNFFAGDYEGILSLPGGNAQLAESLLQNLSQSLDPSHFRPSSLVFHVEVTKNGVLVAYLDAGEKVRVIQAKKVVLACPKFVVPHILKQLEPQRKLAIESLEYRGYLVANVLLKKKIKRSFYDLFFFEEHQETSLNAKIQKQGATDVVYASAHSNDPARTVLTLYRGMPYAGARAELIKPGAYAHFHKEFEEQIIKNPSSHFKLYTKRYPRNKNFSLGTRSTSS